MEEEFYELYLIFFEDLFRSNVVWEKFRGDVNALGVMGE